MNQKQLMKKHRELIEETVGLLTATFDAYYASVYSFLDKTMIQDGEVNPSYSQDYVISSLAARKKQLEQKLQEIVDEQMEEAFLLGFLFFEGVTQEEIRSTYHNSVIKAEVIATLNEVSANTDRRLLQIVRTGYQDKLMADIERRRSLGTISKLIQEKVTAENFYKEVKQNGFVGYVDKLGRRWKPDVYARMLLRTKTMEANIGIQQEQGLLNGIDMAYISGVPVDNPCNNWIGCLVSMNGLTPVLPTYQQVKDTGEVFHPNCQHYLIPVRSFENCPNYVLDRTEQKYGIDLSRYKES